MTDPTGTVGIVGPSPQSDMAAVFAGGTSFMARMQEFEKSRSLSEQKLAELRLGMSAKEAFEEASRKLSEAETSRAQAVSVLDGAKVEAAGILAKAREEAEALVSDAKAAASKVTSAASTKTAKADSYEKEVAERVSAMMAKADAVTSDAEKRAAKNADEAAQLAEARRITDETCAKMEAVRDEYHSRLNKLKAAVQQAME